MRFLALALILALTSCSKPYKAPLRVTSGSPDSASADDEEENSKGKGTKNKPTAPKTDDSKTDPGTTEPDTGDEPDTSKDPEEPDPMIGLTALNTIPHPGRGKGVLVKVGNKCPFPLWIHAAGSQGALSPDDGKLDTGTVRSYVAPVLWTSGRVEAYKSGPRQGIIDKVEMTFDQAYTPSGSDLHYNVTYVDWVGLPVHVNSKGKGDDCKASGCSKPVGTLVNGCPDGLLTSDGRCMSARTFCLEAGNGDKPYCKLLDAKIDECVAKYDDCRHAAGAKTPEVYACSGKFSEDPKYCAAINRGMLDEPTNTDIKSYYKNGPFNSYSKWVHEVCPSIYALAYDDYPPAAAESGYHSCADGEELNITFCPGG